ncbi:MAG: amino acid adenylation domain-containing protein [Pseudonocardiaceae bacterium]
MSGSDGVVLPLSAAQREIWFAEQRLNTANRVYNHGHYVEIPGPVDPVLFETALRRVVGEADALRVRFIEFSDGPRQVVESSLDWLMPFVDVSAKPDPLAAAHAWMTADVARPMDLARGALFSYALIKLRSDRFFWYRGYHHIVMDGFGSSLIARRVAKIYTALAHGRAVGQNGFGSLRQLLEDDASYRASEQFAQDREYWVGRFADRPESARLVGPSSGPSESFVYRATRLSPPVAERLRVAACRAEVPSFLIVIAATAVYMHRLTGARDVVVGLPVTARQSLILKRVPGMVSNVLPLRLSVRPDMSPSELIEKVAREVHEVLAHQRYRGEDLRRDLDLPGSIGTSFTPVVNIMPLYDLRFTGYRSTAHKISSALVSDLSIFVWDRRDDSGLRIGWQAHPEVCGTDDLAAHHQRFVSLLDTITVVDPDQPISRIDLLSADERHRFLVDDNDTADPVPQACLPVLFQTQVQATPQAVAVVLGDVTLTYAQLNTQANRLAHTLIARGIGPEHIVALALPRSPDMIVAILAVLKTGAAYLPLDPDYPPTRITFMLHDAQPALLLTTHSAGCVFPDTTTSQLVLDDPDTLTTLAAHLDTDPTNTHRTTPLHPQHAAYVIYTSGSTGTPKGVVVAHQNVVRLFGATQSWFGFDADDVWTLFHSYAFDVSVWEIWGALLHGGRLVVVPYEVSRSPERFLQLLAREGVTVLSQTPSAFYQLMQADRDNPEMGRSLALRTVVFGGEALEFARLADWYERHPDHAPTLVNMYGITETTVHVTHLILDRYRAAAGTTSVIGTGIPDLRTFVLDAGLQLAPPGVVGELYVGGAGLARGYLGRAGLTAERFVADPFGPPGGRLYRTGDLVRWNTDGNLEFVGRVDDQVKVRGFRIEPGEIETVLAEHPGVARAVVLAREDRPGDQRLVAYVVVNNPMTRPGTDTLSASLREHVRERLPEYMVPAAVVLLDAFPMTPNRKLDRAALPAPEFGAAAGRAPRTPQEQILSELFAAVLGLPAVGIDDDFFDLGGHSLLATRLIARIRTTLGVELGLTALFQTPTVAGLVTCLDTGDTHDALDVILPLRSQGRHPPLFCIHPVGGLSWAYRGLMKHLGPDYPIYAVQARGLARPEPLPTSLEQMAADYADQIRQVQGAGPYFLLGWSFGGLVAHALATELHQRGEQTALLAILDTYPMRDLSAEAALLDGDPDSDEPVRFAQFVDTLRNRGSALASLGEHHISAIYEIMKNNIRLACDFTPRHFPGDLLLFTSTPAPGHDTPSPEAWRPYIGGAIEKHGITSRHRLMMHPEALAQIGPILAATLHDITSGTSPPHRKS